jgi:hypothetical protein
MSRITFGHGAALDGRPYLPCQVHGLGDTWEARFSVTEKIAWHGMNNDSRNTFCNLIAE